MAIIIFYAPACVRLTHTYLKGLDWTITKDASDDADVFAAAIAKLQRKNWIVYAKPPFGSPQHVLAYLGSHTHTVAIARCLGSGSVAVPIP
ncbi:MULTISPECIES: transposase [unclassified Sphingobium]|uniref:transposase n=1 Tax=unclassified Sphingobium TaxID=2611147 RepID=UPI0018C8F1CD|nr:hypothetical protein [Sphingobium sp. JAI105]